MFNLIMRWLDGDEAGGASRPVSTILGIERQRRRLLRSSVSETRQG